MSHLSRCLLIAFVIIVPTAAHADRSTAEYEFLLRKPLRILLMTTGRFELDGPVTIENGKVLYKSRGALYSAPVTDVSIGRFGVDSPVTIENGMARFKSGGVLYAVPLKNIDLEQTARANGIRNLSPPVLKAEERQRDAARKETSAAIAVKQAITTVGLAAREDSGRRSSGDSSVSQQGGRWTFFTGVTGIAESNINEEAVGLRDTGVIPTVGLNFRRKGERGTFEASYTAGFHNYSKSQQWNRTSHNIFASIESSSRRRLRSETAATISIKGANEDRDLSDQYTLSQRFRLRIAQKAIIGLTGGYRVKVYETDPTANSRNPYAGVDFRVGSGVQWSAGYRWEMNSPEEKRGEYRRETASTDLRFPLGSASSLRLGARRREQEYPNRLVRVGSERVPRHDERWIGSLSLSRRFWATLAIALEYQYETRLSNDPKKEFEDHSVGLSVIKFW